MRSPEPRRDTSPARRRGRPSGAPSQDRPTLADRLAGELDWLPDWEGVGPCAAEAAAMHDWPGRAVEVCADCDFLNACRAWVLGLPEPLDPGGVVAGLSAAKRRAARLAEGGAKTLLSSGIDVTA